MASKKFSDEEIAAFIQEGAPALPLERRLPPFTYWWDLVEESAAYPTVIEPRKD